MEKLTQHKKRTKEAPGVLFDLIMPFGSILLLLILSFLFNLTATAQKIPIKDGFRPAVRISAYSGPSIPLGEFKRFAKTGVDLGLSLDYGLNENWGFGIDFNRQLNGYQLPSEFNPTIPASTKYSKSTQIGSGNWTNTTFGFGPWWMVNFNPSGNSYLQVYTKAGISSVKNPGAKVVFAYNGATNNFFAMNAEQRNSNGFGFTAGLNIGLGLSKNLTLNINPQFVYSGVKVNYSYDIVEDGSHRDAYDDSTGQFLPILALHELVTVDKTVNPSHFNLNVGLTYKFGKRDKNIKKLSKSVKDIWTITALDEEERKKSNNERIIIPIYPENNVTYKNSKEINKFIWKVKGKSYIKPEFQIILKSIGKDQKEYSPIKGRMIEIGAAMFEVEWPTVMPILPEGNYVWKVVEKNSGEKSRNYNLKISTSAITMDLKNSTCSDTAIVNGNVNYTGEIEINNPGTSTLTITSFDIIDFSGNQAMNISQINCSTLAPSSFASFTIAPGGNHTICVQYTVPFGETQVLGKVQFTQSSSPSGNIDLISNPDSLPNCICNTCESWKFSTQNNKVTQLNNNWGNMNISQDLQLSGADPIKNVKAAIAYVKHNVNDPQCYTCTKEDNHMGMFRKNVNSGIITTSPTNWRNSGTGELSDENNDNYGNEFTWNSSSAYGVDFNIPQTFKMILNLPKVSALDCCESSYQVCIRYTFTDINCKTCTKLVCYTYNPKPIKGGVYNFNGKEKDKLKENKKIIK